MKKTISILALAITLVNCNTKDPTLICLKQLTDVSFAQSVESLEKHLLSCRVVNDISLSSFSSLVKRSAKERDKIKRCLNDFEDELPSLSNVSILENCCRSQSMNNEYCSKIVQMSEKGISVLTLIEVLHVIEEKDWDENFELRGSVEFLYYFMITNDID